MIQDEKERQEHRDALHSEMFAYLADLNERCEKLLAQRDAFSVYNSVQHLRSLIGQLDSAARRYRSAS